MTHHAGYRHCECLESTSEFDNPAPVRVSEVAVELTIWEYDLCGAAVLASVNSSLTQLYRIKIHLLNQNILFQALHLNSRVLLFHEDTEAGENWYGTPIRLVGARFLELLGQGILWY